ncbi:hypothetical protein Tsubulata_003378 [Turnera subulata]|uniref:START domain-containing protein n=1 Tax=Turnera subulata TaxID=218843 RepID=A0A9Q0GGR5_9ROSI|nr:hypothetical protein Tsubulata_003378 [Turnera subulata]
MSGSSGKHDQSFSRSDDSEEMISDEMYEASLDTSDDDSEEESMEDSEQESVDGSGSGSEWYEDGSESDEEMETNEEVGLNLAASSQIDAVLVRDIEQGSPPPNRSPQHSHESVADSVASNSDNPVQIARASDLLVAVSVVAEVNKTKITTLAASAMDELVRKAFAGEPLWQRHTGGETLNDVEYIREFRAFDVSLEELMKMVEMGDPQDFAELDGDYEFSSRMPNVPALRRGAEANVLRTEASRGVGLVRMNPSTLVECLMDLDQWSSTFSNIVSRSALLGCLSPPAAGNFNEVLQVMRAEFYVPTPLVPARECQFARYCRQFDSRTWGVVDVSLESLLQDSVIKFRRRPSGCLIQEMPNGCSKVLWVEHVEVDDSLVHILYQPLVHSGFPFCAKRWINTMIRHFDGLAALTSDSPSYIRGAVIPQKGKESLLMLSERMVRDFCIDSSASTNNKWMRFPEAEHFRVRTKSITAIPHRPTPTVVFATSVWLPVPRKRVFDYLRHGESRNQWDLLSHERVILEISHINKGQNPDNRVSVMQVNTASNKIDILYLQESYSDPVASYIVYAPLDGPAMACMLRGGNPDRVNILPSGFVVHPDGSGPSTNQEVGSSILTVAFHIIDNSATEKSISPSSVTTISRILTSTVGAIHHALQPDD